MKREDVELSRTLSLLTQLGFTVAACIVGGFALGLFLDRTTKTYPLFLIVFLLIGVATGFWRAYALIMRAINREQTDRNV